MKYDFTSIPDRSGCGSAKWNGAKNASADAVPLSVADMEFTTAPEIKDALSKLAQEQILGYTDPTDDYYNAVISWMERRHDFHIEKEWIVTTPGVVNALGILIEAVTKPGDGIIILTPVYYPFDMAVLAKSRHFVYSELKLNNGRYEIDFTDLEKKAKLPETKAIIFCNPHNPIGRVWTREELQKVISICCKNGVFIIDDEIHNDLIMPGYTHTVMATLGEDIKNNIAVCTAPSKTFNLAGLQCSNIVVPDKKARAKVNACIMLNLMNHLNIFAYEACKTAYNQCEEWLEELLTVIDGNAKYVESFMADKFPEIKVFPLEGTYLQWLDMRALGMTHNELREMLENADIFLDWGEMFGDLGRGFQRINLACARVTLEKTLERFEKAVYSVRENWKINGKPYHKKLQKGDIIEDFVYDSAYGKGKNLKNSIDKKTLLVFTRYYECSICKETLNTFKKYQRVFRMMGIDLKFILQSDLKTVSSAQSLYPFELIADPEAVFYDRYNIFEANSMVRMVAGDKMFEEMTRGDIRNLLDSDLINAFVSEESTPSKHRELQLPAFIGIDKNCKVIYSHYSKTVGDFPDAGKLLGAMRKQ
ncbi:MAG: PatB family C-S lyase [Clostridia bacterium]|nr:PatB family C-S lyase [Clostridia bacterium]